MTAPQFGEGIHQVFFGWSFGSDEHLVVASSFDEVRQNQWRRRLQDHTRLQPVPGFELPATALSCLEFNDDFVAVVRRVGGGNSLGRNDTHVLIGTSDVLNPSLALRLERWGGWQDVAPQTSVGTISPAYLLECAGPSNRSAALIKPFEKLLVVAVSRLVERPDAPLSIIGCPDEHRLSMVWALRAAATVHLTQVSGLQRKWTFSTYEKRHADHIEYLPEIVFLPKVPNTGEPHNRAIVRFGEEPPDNSKSAEIAQQLVNSLLYSASLPVMATGPVNNTVAGPAFDQGSHPAPSTTAASVRHQPSEVVVGQQSSRRAAKGAREILVQPLLDAKDVKTFQAALLNVGDRDQLRQVFHADTADRLAEFVEVDAVRELFTMELMALYGKDFADLKDPVVREHAAQLVKKCRSDQFAVMLGARLSRYARAEVTEPAIERWLRYGMDLKPAPRRRVRRRLPWEEIRRRRVIWSFVAAFLLLVLGFLGGYLAARPAKGQSSGQPVTTTVTTTSAAQNPQTAQNPPNPQTPQLKSGRVAITAKVDQQVFAFIRVDDRYYAHGPCTPADAGSTTWKCEQVYEPPPGAGSPSDLVAIVVPKDEAQRLLLAVSQQEGRKWQTGVWASFAPVVP